MLLEKARINAVSLGDRLKTTVARFRRGESGAAATEFALMVPVMMSVWIGMVVATDALTADKKVTLLARTLADMTTQMQAVSQADMDSIFQATESVMWPQPAQAMGMRVVALDVDGAGNVFVDWSVVPTNTALKGSFSALARCTNYTTLPAGLKINRTSIVLAEVTMNYQATAATAIVDQMFSGVATGGQMPLSDSLYMRPRQTTKVSFNPPPAGNCPGYVP